MQPFISMIYSASHKLAKAITTIKKKTLLRTISSSHIKKFRQPGWKTRERISMVDKPMACLDFKSISFPRIKKMTTIKN